MRRARRGAIHGRLAALEARAASKTGGPLIGFEDPLSLAVHADGGRMFASKREFFDAGRKAGKMPLLIQRDCELSPHSRPAVPQEAGK